MTRVEKYQAYRDEIAKSQKLGKSIKTGDENVIKYTKEIDKINPSILSTFKNNNTLTFEKGTIDINIDQKQVPENVTKLFNTLNQTAISTQNAEINNYFNNKIQHTILDSNGDIDQNWLATNQLYTNISKINNDVNNNIAEEKVFVEDLTNKYNSMKQENGIVPVQKLEQVPLDKKKSKMNAITMSVIITTAVIVVALIILIIVKGVKG